MRITLYILVLFPPPKKNNTKTVLLKLSILAKQGKSEKLSRPKGAEGDWWLNTRGHPGWDFRRAKGHTQTNGIWIKYGLYLTIMCQYWFVNCDECTIQI